MIIRILGEGQFEISDADVARLNELDDRLEAAVEAEDESTYAATLSQLLDRVRSTGTAVALDKLVPSDLVLPGAGATLAEVRDLVSGDGLIPGRADSVEQRAKPEHEAASSEG